MTECTCDYDPFQCAVTHDGQPIDGQMTIDDAIEEE